MSDLRYPVGMATFPELIEEGYAYVDKTQYIKPLLRHGKFIFLSRPRRFGKSLLLSTLQAYFEGRRELFKGLAADTMDLDWTPSPVLRFDFNSEDFDREDGLDILISGFLNKYEKIYVNGEKSSSISQRFKDLIESANEKTGRKVVILIDEYDKPLLDLESHSELFDHHQRKLKSFFGNLKTMDACIRFVFITGVARFAKVSIFSDLNNLKDISMTNEYADICGWTEEELVKSFSVGIEQLAEERGEDFDQTLKELRNYYDGYMFAPKGQKLYNPYSLLNALDDQEIEPYWYISGTPTFLARWVKNNGLYPKDINGVEATKMDLVSVGFDDMNPIPLMFQTGYLSIESYDRESQVYRLRIPNREVEIGFYRNLLRLYAPATGQGGVFDLTRFKSDIAKGNIDDFMKRLQTLLKDLPGKDHKESTYRAITYMLAMICGTKTIAEHDGYKGISDLEVYTSRFIYLFEFKYNKSVKEAFDQIYDRDYAGRFAMDSRKIYLIGANFDKKKDKRGLEYEIREA